MTLTTNDYPVMGEVEARRLTERIRVTAVTFADSRQKLIQYVQEAKDGHAHVALGYASWTAYLAEVLGEEPMRLARDERKDMVQLLAAEGMSTRAIAPIVGANQATVVRDLAGDANASPEPAPAAERVVIAEQRHINIDTGEIFPEQTKITGMDGKTYQRPNTTSPQPRAEATTSQFTSAIVELNRVMNRLHRISENPNYNRNKNQVATLHGSDLARTISELQNLLAELTN